MRILIVTSQITFVPNNDQIFFDELLKKANSHIVGLVIIQNFSLDLFPKIIWLYWMGCTNFATSLVRNILDLPFQKRERAFKKIKHPVFQAKNINDPRIVSWIKKNKIDLIINIRTRCIYKSAILSTPRLGCINIHHGLLPKYRGIFCDLYALYEKRPAGITVHKMSEKLDDGRIIFRKHISQSHDNDYMKYLAKTGHEEADMIIKLMKYIDQKDSLPKGIRNYSKQVLYTKTPNKQQIRDMRESGLIL